MDAHNTFDAPDVVHPVPLTGARLQGATVFILLLTYFIAAIVWRNNPEQMQAFVRTEIGSYSVAGSMVLQCAGVVWMNWIGKARF
jgi:Flp pilus assembly protein TadB